MKGTCPSGFSLRLCVESMEPVFPSSREKWSSRPSREVLRRAMMRYYVSVIGLFQECLLSLKSRQNKKAYGADLLNMCNLLHSIEFPTFTVRHAAVLRHVSMHNEYQEEVSR